MTKKTASNNQSSFEPRSFGQIFLSMAKGIGIIIIPILLVGALVLSISGIGFDPILWFGCLSIPILVGLSLAVLMTLLSKDIYRVFPYAELNTNQAEFRKKLVDEKLIINSNHYRIVYSHGNEFHFQFRMSPKLRIRLLDDRAEAVGAQFVINELSRLFEKLPRHYAIPETYEHSSTSGTCYLCGESFESGQGYLVPITVAFTTAFRYLVSSAPDSESIAVRRGLLQKVRQSGSSRGDMETLTRVCPECAQILS